jgi:hypothetical protein
MTRDPDDDLPTPGPNEPVPAWAEYDRLKETIHDYLDHEPDNPQWNDIWRVLAAIMGESQRDAFVDAFDLAEPAETPCIRRLITGERAAPVSKNATGSNVSSKPSALVTTRHTPRRTETTARSGSTSPATPPSTGCTSIPATSRWSRRPRPRSRPAATQRLDGHHALGAGVGA